MERQIVRSSNIRAIGYDAESSTLEVEFQSGDVYQYTRVPATVHAALMKARSKGAYLNQHVKNTYQCRQIT
ncbi:MAG: KTSC domain-containing protein [Thermoguttaceae bacterium]|jgi:hypothetical protein